MSGSIRCRTATPSDRKKFTLTRIDPARRGTVYSADHKALAEDAQAYELNVRFDKVPHSDAFRSEEVHPHPNRSCAPRNSVQRRSQSACGGRAGIRAECQVR